MPFNHASAASFRKPVDCPHHFYEDDQGNVLVKCISRRTTSGGVALNKSAFEYLLAARVKDNQKWFRLENWNENVYWEGTIDQLPRHFVWKGGDSGSQYVIIDPDEVEGWHTLPPREVVANTREEVSSESTQVSAKSSLVNAELKDLDLPSDNPKMDTLLRFCKRNPSITFMIDKGGWRALREVKLT